MLIRNRLLSLALSLLLLLSAAAHAQTPMPGYMKQDSARFRVVYRPPDSEVVHDLWRTIRERVPMVEQRLRLALADTVTFIVAPDEKEWARLAQGVPLWANGFAYSQQGVAVVKSPRFGLPYGPLPVTAVHEYVHLLLEAGAPDAYFPRWLNEGLAQLLAGQYDFMDQTVLARAAASGRLLGLYRIEGLMGMNAHGAQQGYAESLAAVQLLEQRWGMAGISNLVHELRAGRSYEEAFSTIFGLSPGAFESLYIKHVQDTYRLGFFGDVELWVSLAFVVLVLAGGAAMYVRRRRIKAQWEEEDRRDVGPSGDIPPPFTINYTIVRNRLHEDEPPDAPEAPDNPEYPGDRPRPGN